MDLKLRITAAALVTIAFLAGPAAAADVQNGAALATKNCAKCHGSGGKGDGPAVSLMNMTPPPTDWTDKAKMSGETAQQLTNIIEGGGAAANKSKHMPAYKNKLTDAQVADIVAYIQSLSK
ncbi:MAG TPA: cytochrome c [Candidatus Binataceae bacterium]|nr:cytochrome c [Candidatus Binataceae bacterium]